MAKNKQLLKIHAKKYIEQVFAQRLKDEGFLCPDDRYLCWYRFLGKEVVHSIVFFSCWTMLPMMLEIGYGIHPLFQMPAYTTDVNYTKRSLDFEIFYQQPLVEKGPIGEMSYVRYSEEIQVMAPGKGDKGLYTLDKIILPKMKGRETIESCYQQHKQQYLDLHCGDSANSFNRISAVFIDEAVYLDDQEMYPYGIESAEKAIGAYRRHCSAYPQNKAYQNMLQEWELRRTILLDNGRKEYLEILEDRRKRNVACLKKKMGLMI